MKSPEVKFIKYGRLQTLSSPDDIKPYSNRYLTVFEKVDGGNCQVRKVGEWQLAAGNKANFLHGAVLHSREWFKRLNGWMYGNHSLYNLPQDIIMFGEWSGNHEIEYTPENTDRFYVIDVFSLETGRFMDYSVGRAVLEFNGIKDVRFLEPLARRRVDPITLKRLLEEPSALYPEEKEGLVIKDYNSTPQEFFRLYHPAHAEKVSGKDGKVNYLIPARFSKGLFRLRDYSGKPKVSLDELVVFIADEIKRDERATVRQRDVKNELRKLLEENRLNKIQRYLID